MCQYFKDQGLKAPPRDPVLKLRNQRCAFALGGVYNSRARRPTRPEEVAGMFLNKISNARRVTLGCASLLVLVIVGCSMNTRNSDATGSSPAPTAAPAASDTDQAATEPQTDTEALGDVESDTGTTTVMVNAGPALKASAPKDYVVKRGDTLWGIANMFLRDPWLWPEIWYINPDIHNPHRIYPGDTVRLALRGDGRTALEVVRGGGGVATRLEPMLRSIPLGGPVATLPYW